MLGFRAGELLVTVEVCRRINAGTGLRVLVDCDRIALKQDEHIDFIDEDANGHDMIAAVRVGPALRGCL